MARTPDISFETRLAQSWVQGCRGYCEEALSATRAVRTEAEAIDQRAICARADQQIAWFTAQLGRAPESLEPILTAIASWKELGNEVEVARANATYAWVLMELGDSDKAIPESSDALLLAERTGDKAVLALACNTQALALVYSGQLDSAAPLLERAVELGRQVDDPHALSRWLVNRAYLQASFGDRAKETGDAEGHLMAYRRALELNEEGVALAEAHHSAWVQRVGLANAAEYCGVLGELETAETYLRRWEKVVGAVGDRVYIQYFYTQSELLARAGRIEEARTMCELALDRAQASGNTLHELNAARRLSDVHEAAGDFKAALELFKRHHLLYKKFSGETAQRRARITQVLLETEKFKSLADQANLRADQMAADALLDPLTGIANRRALDRELGQLDADPGSPYSVAIVDLDHFKLVNDLHSHLVGDDVLKLVAETLSLTIRPGDLVARMGGEEFAVVLRGASAEAAESVCERFRTRLAALDWELLSPGLAVTASIGLADGAEGGSARETLGLADTRLYAAKSAGRNRVVGQNVQPRALVH